MAYLELGDELYNNVKVIKRSDGSHAVVYGAPMFTDNRADWSEVPVAFVGSGTGEISFVASHVILLQRSYTAGGSERVFFGRENINANQDSGGEIPFSIFLPKGRYRLNCIGMIRAQSGQQSEYMMDVYFKRGTPNHSIPAPTISSSGESPNDLGKALFWADGQEGLVTRYGGTTGAWSSENTSNGRRRISDEILEEEGAYYYFIGCVRRTQGTTGAMVMSISGVIEQIG
ncbi:MAG: hypothetical protein LBH98_06430 [Chitinispirillales bacterium]|jgi:hypothetical protein|nr:hypothetical protein [Chitinispirillales bacterium]